MRIGILGGSFNPIHNLHKEMGLKVLENNLVDKVIYVPTGDKYAKTGLIDGIDRFNMIKLAIEDIYNLEVSDYEVKRGCSYTFETLDYFKKLYPKDNIYFILSTDLILDIENWKEPEYILKNYKLIGLKREGYEYLKLPNIYNKYPDSLEIYNFNMGELSSTKIREKIQNNKQEELEKYLDKKVLEYINLNNLYK